MFEEKRSSIMGWNGITIYGLFEFKVIPERFELRFLSAKEFPVQGIHLRVKGGTLAVNDCESSNIVVWQDTAPQRVDVQVRALRKGARLMLWNIWKESAGVTQAWLGNSALQVDVDSSRGFLKLRCSDGVGEPDFEDLIVEVGVLDVSAYP